MVVDTEDFDIRPEALSFPPGPAHESDVEHALNRIDLFLEDQAMQSDSSATQSSESEHGAGFGGDHQLRPSYVVADADGVRDG